MARRKRKEHETQAAPSPPGSEGRRLSRSTLGLAAGLAILVLASILFLVWRPTGAPDQELAEGESGRAERDSASDGGANQGVSSAAEFQAELYGLVEPLVAKLPKSTRARCLLATVHRRFARLAEAEHELQQCLAEEPACAEAHYLLGMMAWGESDAPRAEKHLRAAFDSDPRWADVALQLAKAQLAQANPQAAVSTLEAYLKLEPGHAEAWCHLGQAYHKRGDFTNAKRCHEKAMELAPDLPEAYYGAGQALRELGQTDEAGEYFERFRQMRSSLTAGVREEKARMTDEDFLRRDLVDIATKAGAVYAMHGYLPEAGQCWRRVTALDPANIECRKMLCRLRPGEAEPWLQLGLLLIQADRLEEAEMPFQRLIELEPRQAAGYAGLAEVYVRLDKDPERAVQLARTAVQWEPTASNHFVLAAACERVEDWAGADAALTRAIELNPAEPMYREAHARLQKARQP